MMDTIHIACSTDDNYAALCGIMLCSLMENNKNNKLHIHILGNDLSEDNRKKLSNQACNYGVPCTFHSVDESKLNNCQYRTKVHKLSKAAYYRILLASTLTEVERVIYLDCDMVILKDLSDVYNENIDGFGVAAVRDYDMLKIPDHYNQIGLNNEDYYFNSGFMLINLNYWRKHDSESALVSFATKPRHVYFHDQDALNFVFKRNWKILEPKWNRYNIFNINVDNLFDNIDSMNAFFDNPCVIHYPGRYFKPWFRTWFIPYKHEWQYYKSLSEWGDFAYKKNERTTYAITKRFVTDLKHIIYRIKYYAHWNKRLRR